MALIKFGGGVTQMSGSLAGNTFARNRFGNYSRSRTKPTNPNTSWQRLIRDAVAYLTQYWRTDLSSAERIAWGAYADSVSMKNRLGESVKLTGFNHFIRGNSPRQARGIAIVDAGPAELALPEKDSTVVITASAATQKITVAFDNTLPWAGEVGGYILLYQGVPQNGTRNFFMGPFRYMSQIAGLVVPPVSPVTPVAIFTFAEAQKIWIKARILRADGRLSECMYFSCTAGV